MKSKGKIILIALALIIFLGVSGSSGAPERNAQAAASEAVTHMKLTPPGTPTRGLQVMSFDCESWEEVSSRLDEFKAAGVKIIILRVFQNEGDGYYRFVEPRYKAGVYFKTYQAPVVADVLGPVIKMAHARGIGVIAWMTTRYANYGREDLTDLRAMAWDFGKKDTVLKKGYSPLIPQAQDKVAALYADLAKYPIDGVLLQDDLVLRHTEGMNPKARELYFSATGKKAFPDLFWKKVEKRGSGYFVGEYTDEFREWCRWKNSVMVLFAERLRRVIQNQRPRPVGINLYYETVTAPDNAMAWYSQSVDAVIDSELDFYALMLYHRQMGKELKLSRDQVFDLIDESIGGLLKKVDHPQRVWVKVQCVDWDTKARIPHAELDSLLARVARTGPVGMVVIPAPRSLDLNKLKTSFSRGLPEK